MPRDKVPDRAKWATCPRCKHRFEFSSQAAAFGFEQVEEPSGFEDRELRESAPWEKRSELGIWGGIYETSKAALFSPEKLFSTMNCRRGIREPLGFGLLVGSIGSMFGFFWQFLVMGSGFLKLATDLVGQMTLTMLFIILMALVPIFVLVAMFFSSAVLHVLLLIVGGGKGGFEATFRVVSYSQATQVLGIVPFIGGLAASLWQFIVQIIGLREIHETSYLRVIIAILIPFGLIILGIMAVVMSLVFLK